LGFAAAHEVVAVEACVVFSCGDDLLGLAGGDLGKCFPVGAGLLGERAVLFGFAQQGGTCGGVGGGVGAVPGGDGAGAVGVFGKVGLAQFAGDVRRPS
jgi:hypothetical protein